MKQSDTQKKLNAVNSEMVIVKDTISALSKKLTQLEKEKKELEQLLLKENPPEISITDHAIIRYCERVYGLQLDSIREEILKEIKDISISKGKIVTKDLSYVIQQNKIVTIY